MNLVGQVLENRYKLGEPIGIGGMGTVYLAEHVLLGEKCAVKVLSRRFAFDPEWVDRFLLEARAAIRIRHEHIVEVKDFACPEPGLVYMVMEAIAGESLSDLLKREGAVSWRRALKMVDDVASALEAAHACGIIHRDIKPSNCIRTTLRGDTDFIKVLDFGIAKFAATTVDGANAPRTAIGVWMGTAEYMAPEMYRGEPPDDRVDIYALGVLLYKLITSETPYQGSHIEVALEQSQGSPTPPSRRAPERNIPAHVDALVLRALAWDLKSRTPSMTALREEIAAILTGPAEAALVVDIEDYEPTQILRLDRLTAPAISTPARPPTPAPPPRANLPVTAKPPAAAPSATKPPEPAKPTAPPLTRTPAPATPTVTAPRSPAHSPTQPVPLPRAAATQTKPHRAVPVSFPPVLATEVTPSRRRTMRAPLAAMTLTGIIVLTAMMWRVTAPTARETAIGAEPASAEISPQPAAPPPAPVIDPVIDPAPAPAATPSTDLPSTTTPLPPDETLILEEPPPSERPARKPRPSNKKAVEPPPVVDQRPLSVTKKDIEGTLGRIQRECAGWGVSRGTRATLEISIDSEGKATHQKIGTSDPFFVDCLKEKLQKSRFPQSQNGGKFRHDFVCC